MTKSLGPIAIDARTTGPAGPWGLQLLNNRPVLAHHIELAAALRPNEICIHSDFENASATLAAAERAAPAAARLVLTSEPPALHAHVLRTDRVYDPRLVDRAMRRGQDPECAVLWRLDAAHDLAAAGEELKRRTTYQPLGSFWAWLPARALARALKSTSVRPNDVTLAATACMGLAALLVALANTAPVLRIATALALALALVLDTADGHLARIQGTATAFGKWLDTVLDEFCDVLLHGAIAWAAFVRWHQASWLIAGMMYVSGKYLFFQSFNNMIENNNKGSNGRGPESLRGTARGAAMTVRALAHADVRWHLWIVAALFGCLEWCLVLYVLYYPARVLATALRWKRSYA